MIERQELYCHNCGGYVQFDMDLSLNGNHILTCPNCGHEHCRVVKDGIITDIRWDQRNNNSSPNVNTIFIPTGSVSFTTQSTFNTYVSGTNYVTNPTQYVTITTGANSSTGDLNGRSFLYGSWMNAVSTT